jgi:uncharacterized protein
LNIVEEIRKFVKEECLKPSSKYGFEPFEYHFEPTVEWADKLVDKLGGDREVVLIATWLHDIGSILDGRKNHHLTGPEIAEEKLRELNYPQEKIELVKKCILNHRGSLNNKRETIEEQIVAEADVISNFDNVVGIISTALIYENKTEGEAKQEVLKKLERKWKQLHFEESRKLIKPKLKAVRLLFSKQD